MSSLHIKLSFPRAYGFLELPTFKHWEIAKEKKKHLYGLCSFE